MPERIRVIGESVQAQGQGSFTHLQIVKVDVVSFYRTVVRSGMLLLDLQYSLSGRKGSGTGRKSDFGHRRDPVN